MAQVPIINYAGIIGYAEVDTEDAERLKAWSWHMRGQYAARAVYERLANGSNKIGAIYMHREIAGATKGQTVHHINSNKLDNRRENLQLHSGSHGTGVAYICADCGSHNVVAVPLKKPTAIP